MIEMVFSELLQRFLVTESTPEQADRAISNNTIKILDTQFMNTPSDRHSSGYILANNDSGIQWLILVT